MQTLSPYRTAAALGIEAWEHEGLAALVKPLAEGALRLDMRTAHCAVSDDATDACGSVACIGGHIAIRRGMSPLEAKRYVDAHKPVGGVARGTLGPLYFPALPNAWGCSAAQAGAAIVNVLSLGEPMWDQVMRGAG